MRPAACVNVPTMKALELKVGALIVLSAAVLAALDRKSVV